jgi:hypothetical protein
MHSQSEWCVVNDDSATMALHIINILAPLSLRKTTACRAASDTQNFFYFSDESFITDAGIAELICEDERDGIQIKNKFSARKNNFFLDKKKLI